MKFFRSFSQTYLWLFRYMFKNWVLSLGALLFTLAVLGVISGFGQNFISSLGAIAVVVAIILVIIGAVENNIHGINTRPWNKVTFSRIAFWIACLPAISGMFYVSPSAVDVYRYTDGTEIVLNGQGLFVPPFSGRTYGPPNTTIIEHKFFTPTIATGNFSVRITPAPKDTDEILAASRTKDVDWQETMSIILKHQYEQNSDCSRPNGQGDVRDCLRTICQQAKNATRFTHQCTYYVLTTKVMGEYPTDD